MTETLKDMQTHELQLLDADGRTYIGRITGSLIADDDDAQVYLTDDERVIGYDKGNGEYHVLGQQEDLAEALRSFLRDDEVYAEALYALGKTPVKDI